MNILHVGALSSPFALDGVNATIWQAAAAQAVAGHHVTLLAEREPEEPDRIAANAMGISLVPVPTGRVIYDADAITTISRGCDIVHLHSVFILRQAMLARQLSRLGVPYVITPNGGLSPTGLRRGFVKKTIYSLLLERPKIMPHKPAMVTNLRRLFGASAAVNIKAGTNEQCDAVGRGEAVVAHAVVLLSAAH